MVRNTTHIFISSSSDLADSREDISCNLKQWLKRIGHGDDVKPYLWDKATENGDLLSNRQKIQPQLLDPLDWSVPFTICLFGERCGVPLEENLKEDWLARLETWRATDDRPGLVHPWPLEDEAAQLKLLERGDFPLTGTVFELISASAAPEDYENLIVCYSTSLPIESTTSIDELFFNDRKEFERLRREGRSPREQDALIIKKYHPQILALLNFLKYFITQKNGNPEWCVSETMMRKQAFNRAKKKLKIYYDLGSDHNPFKLSLEHWKLEDPELPGRQSLIKGEILPILLDTSAEEKMPLVLITGPSGCGKSSVLQRGVLGALERKGMVVLPIRPTDLDTVDELDRLDIFWEMVVERIEGCHISGMRTLRRDERMARRLIKVLQYRNLELVIGIDQFEEMLDEMAQFKSKVQRTRGWWLLLRFFNKIAKSPRVKLVATLERSRRKTFDALKIESTIGLPFRTVPADITSKEIVNIARNGFELGGLTLGSSLLQEIQDKWDSFVKKGGSSTLNASPLPLACLWFAQLYARFEDRAEKIDIPSDIKSIGREMAKANTSKPVLTLDDIGGPDAVAFEDVIAQMANEAWEEAYGKAPPEGDIVQNADAYTGLIGFLDPLVALDGEGHLRLLSSPPDGSHKYFEMAYLAFIKRRLLVPTGRHKRVRLVHQAVVNQWRPAQEWHSWRESYLKTEFKLLEAAKAWSLGGRERPRKNNGLIQQAAEVLWTNDREWSLTCLETVSKDNRALRDYCLEHLSNATDALAPILTSLADHRIISVAASYHVVPLLKKLLKSNPEAFFIKTKDQRTLLKLVASADGPATEMLINMAHDRGDIDWIKTPDKGGWHPIAAAIQESANSNFRLLIKEYDDCNTVVASDDRKMLHIAAMVDNLEVAQYLVNRPEIKINLRDSDSFSAIDTAAWFGSERVFRLLLKRADFISEHNFNPLHRAARKGRASIIEAALQSQHLDEQTKVNALVDKPSPDSTTPLMEAALGRQPEALAVLLNDCNPCDEVHCKSDGSALLHLILYAEQDSRVSADEQQRAKKCVQILLNDGRVDIMALAIGKTAYEIGARFKDARRVLRQHMPLDYATMSDALRREDLLSSTPKEYRRLLEQAPQVLSDKLGGTTGLDLLINEKRSKVIAEILQKGLASFSVRRRWHRLISLASEVNEAELRRSLVDVIPANSKADLAPLLDAAMRDADGRENDLVAALLTSGVKLTRGTGVLGASVFHGLAIVGDIERFEILAANHSFVLPLDDWGRAPSELASLAKQDGFKSIEARYFKGTRTVRKTTADWSPYLALERDSGEKLDVDTRRKVIATIRKIDGIPKFDARQTQTVTHDLSFYKNTKLVVATNPHWKGGLIRICFLLKDGVLTRLAGTSPPIHEFNAQIKYKALKSSVREYLAFFCFFIRGEEGPFLVVDRPDNIFVPKNAHISKFERAFRPVKLWGRDAQGNWFASACVYYSNALFYADFLIHHSGMIEMLGDTPIVDDLDGTVDAPLTH